MARRNVYTVAYNLFGQKKEKVDVIAQNKAEAYDIATFEIIPKEEGRLPYSAWVESVTYQNGNTRTFNTFEGNPY